jgi:hypothetical protein
VLAHWGYTVHAVAGVQLNRWLGPAVRETKLELAIHTIAPRGRLPQAAPRPRAQRPGGPHGGR